MIIPIGKFDYHFWEEIHQKRLDTRDRAKVQRLEGCPHPSKVLTYTDPRDLYLVSMATAAETAKEKGYNATPYTRKEIKSLLLAERAEAKKMMLWCQRKVDQAEYFCNIATDAAGATESSKIYHLALVTATVYKDKYDYITQHMDDLIALWLRLIGAPSEAPKPAARSGRPAHEYNLALATLKAKHAKAMARLKARHAEELLSLMTQYTQGGQDHE